MKSHLNLLIVLVMSIFYFSCSSQSGGSIILIETSYGNMKFKLYDETPQHKANFIKLASEGFYNGTLFHRVISNFMIQGGDPNSKGAAAGTMLGSGDVGYLIPAEIKRYHFKGTLAAARKGDAVNPEKKSSGCQFYIVQGQKLPEQQIAMMAAQKGIKYTAEEIKRYTTEGGTPFLDGDYTVFGELIEGLDVLDKIAVAQTAPGDRPLQDISMKVSVVSK